jgi:hypothetical protein
MITTTINWKSASPEQRNDACAKFMPPSDVNPILSWHLLIGDHDMGALHSQSKKEADDFLSFLQSDREQWERVMGKYATWDHRTDCQIVEHLRSVNYTSTPGGAWMLLEELRSRGGYSIIIAIQDNFTRISATPPTPAIDPSPDFVPPTTGFMGVEPFSELAGMLFLTLNGVQVIQ